MNTSLWLRRVLLIVALSYLLIRLLSLVPAPQPTQPDLAPIKQQLDTIQNELRNRANALQEQQDDLKKRQDYLDSVVEKIRKQNLQRTSFEESLKCLADNIYYEAAFEPEEGKIAVAQVTINRLNDPDYPKTVCGVVYERHRTKANRIAAAFSWTLTPFRPKGPKSHKVYEEVLGIARAVLTKKEKSDIIGDDVIYYHRYDCHPEWANEHTMVTKIGNHIFYSKKEKDGES